MNNSPLCLYSANLHRKLFVHLCHSLTKAGIMSPWKNDRAIYEVIWFEEIFFAKALISWSELFLCFCFFVRKKAIANNAVAQFNGRAWISINYYALTFFLKNSETRSNQRTQTSRRMNFIDKKISRSSISIGSEPMKQATIYF